MNTEEKLDYINQHIGIYPDFPKKGIVYRDIFGALTDGKACKYLKEVLLEHIRSEHLDVDVIVGLESRGFLFNMMLASELGIGCVPIRKKGKLPGKCVSIEYTLEYGTDVFEIQKEAIKPGQKVIIVDDFLATGGTLEAAVKLVCKTGGEVVKCLVVMELEQLGGRNKVGANVHSLIKY